MDKDRPDDDIADLFDRIRVFEPDATVVDWPPHERAKWKVKMRAEDEARYGRTPRNDWPPSGRQYTEADLKERDYWIRKLYDEEQLTLGSVAEQLGIDRSTISRRVLHMGIGRGRAKIGKDSAKVRQVEIRRRQVRQLHENGAGPREISAELGWHMSTIYTDLREMGLPLQPPPRRNGLSPQATWERVDDSIRQLAGISHLVLTAKLGKLEATPEQLREWEDRLQQVFAAVRKLRKTMKGNDNDE